MPVIFSDGKSAWGFTLAEHRAKWKSDWVVALTGTFLMGLLGYLMDGGISP